MTRQRIAKEISEFLERIFTWRSGYDSLLWLEPDPPWGNRLKGVRDEAWGKAKGADDKVRAMGYGS